MHKRIKAKKVKTSEECNKKEFKDDDDDDDDGDDNNNNNYNDSTKKTLKINKIPLA